MGTNNPSEETVIVQLDRQLDPSRRRATLGQLEAWAEAHGGQALGGLTPGDSVDLRVPESVSTAELAQFPGVLAVLVDENAPRLVGDLAPKTVVAGKAEFGPERFAVIAGPCAVENENQLVATARKLAAAGAVALRGGAFKPRTSPYAFRGLGAAGLEALAAARQATGLAVVTELLDPRDATLVAETADLIQIGSRNMSNFPLLREVGQLGKPVLLKRGMSATVAEFVLAAEHIAAGGTDQIVLCERGLRHFDPAVRNLLDLSVVPVLRERTGLPVLVDPSHAAGRASLVPSLMAAAAAVGADGLLVEVHPDPAASPSDPDQALDPDAFAEAMRPLPAILGAIGRQLQS